MFYVSSCNIDLLPFHLSTTFDSLSICLLLEKPDDSFMFKHLYIASQHSHCKRLLKSRILFANGNGGSLCMFKIAVPHDCFALRDPLFTHLTCQSGSHYFFFFFTATVQELANYSVRLPWDFLLKENQFFFLMNCLFLYNIPLKHVFATPYYFLS